MRSIFLKLFLLIIFALFLLSPVYAGREIDGFRGIKWGMSQEEVISQKLNSGAKLISIDGKLSFVEYLDSIPMQTSYLFSEKGKELIAILIRLDLESIAFDKNLQLNYSCQKDIDYVTSTLEEELTKKHGFPKEVADPTLIKKLYPGLRNYEIVETKLWERDWEKDSGVIYLIKSKLKVGPLNLVVPDFDFYSPSFLKEAKEKNK